MIKKKAKNKTAKRKTAKKKFTTRSKKERNPAAVRNDIAKMVESGAKKITQAVMTQAMNGQVAPAKFLFEMASIFPPITDGSQASAEEESLAATLLRRLDMPDEPVMRDEEDAPVKSVVPVEKAVAKPDEAKGAAELETHEESTESVLV